jgi:hypothetical protein
MALATPTPAREPYIFVRVHMLNAHDDHSQMRNETRRPEREGVHSVFSTSKRFAVPTGRARSLLGLCRDSANRPEAPPISGTAPPRRLGWVLRQLDQGARRDVPEQVPRWQRIPPGVLHQLPAATLLADSVRLVHALGLPLRIRGRPHLRQQPANALMLESSGQ